MGACLKRKAVCQTLPMSMGEGPQPIPTSRAIPTSRERAISRKRRSADARRRRRRKRRKARRVEDGHEGDGHAQTHHRAHRLKAEPVCSKEVSSGVSFLSPFFWGDKNHLRGVPNPKTHPHTRGGGGLFSGGTPFWAGFKGMAKGTPPICGGSKS